MSPSQRRPTSSKFETVNENQKSSRVLITEVYTSLEILKYCQEFHSMIMIETEKLEAETLPSDVVCRGRVDWRV